MDAQKKPNKKQSEDCQECGELPYDRIYKKRKLCDFCIIEIEAYEELVQDDIEENWS